MQFEERNGHPRKLSTGILGIKKAAIEILYGLLCTCLLT